MKKRRAHSLPSLLLFIGLAAALTFAVAGRFVARQRFTVSFRQVILDRAAASP